MKILTKEEFWLLTTVRTTEYGLMFETKTDICKYGQAYRTTADITTYIKFYYRIYLIDMEKYNEV